MMTDSDAEFLISAIKLAWLLVLGWLAWRIPFVAHLSDRELRRSAIELWGYGFLLICIGGICALAPRGSFELSVLFALPGLIVILGGVMRHRRYKRLTKRND